MKIFKLTIVIFTSLFMSYHTQIFLQSIEPNLIFSWIAALLVEMMIMSLAMSIKRHKASLIFLIPLYVVSTVAASSSFIASNEQELKKLFTQKQQIALIQQDLQRTQQGYSLGKKYISRTLERERKLYDMLHQLTAQTSGTITVAKAIIFFIFVTIIQASSIYIASTLTATETVITTQTETLKQPIETDKTVMPETPETGETVIDKIETKEKTEIEENSRESKDNASSTVLDSDKNESLKEKVLKLKQQGKSYRQIAQQLHISPAKVARLLKSS